MPDVLEVPLVVATLDDGARKHTSSFRLVTSYPFATKRGGLSLVKSMSGGVEIPARGGLRLSTSHATTHHPHYALEENSTLVHHSSHPRELLAHTQNRHFRSKSSSQAAVRCLSINRTMRANERWVLLNKETFQEIFDATLHEMTRTPGGGDYLNDKDGDVDDHPPSPVTPECHYMRHNPEVGGSSLSAAISRVYRNRKHFSDRMQVNPGEACIPEGTNIVRQMSPPCQENQGFVAAPPMESAKTNALCDITNDHDGHQRYTPSTGSSSSSSSSPSPGPTSPVTTSPSIARGARSPHSPLPATTVVLTQQAPETREIPDRENEPLDLSNKHSPVRAQNQQIPSGLSSIGGEQETSGSGDPQIREQVPSWSSIHHRPPSHDEHVSLQSPCSPDNCQSNCCSGTGNEAGSCLKKSSSPSPLSCQMTSERQGLRQGVKVSASANNEANERDEVKDVPPRGEGEVTVDARSSANGSPTTTPPPPIILDQSPCELQTDSAEGAALAEDSSDEPVPDDPRALRGVSGGREGCGGALAKTSHPPQLPSSSCTATADAAVVGSANSSTTSTTITTAQPACCSTSASSSTTTTAAHTSGTSQPTTDSTQRQTGKVTPGVGAARTPCNSASGVSDSDVGVGGHFISETERGDSGNSSCSSSSNNNIQRSLSAPDNKQVDRDKLTAGYIDILDDTTALDKVSVDDIEAPGVTEQSSTAGGGECGDTLTVATSRCAEEGGKVGTSSSSAGKLVSAPSSHSSSSGKVSKDFRMTTTAASSPSSVHHHHHLHRRISVGGGGGGNNGGAVKPASENWAPLNKATVYDLVEEVMISLGESKTAESNSKPEQKNNSQPSENTQAYAAVNCSNVVNKSNTPSISDPMVNNNNLIRNCVALSTSKSTRVPNVLNSGHIDVNDKQHGRHGLSGSSDMSSALERRCIASPHGTTEDQGVIVNSGHQEGGALGLLRGSRTKCQLRDHLLSGARSSSRASSAASSSSLRLNDTLLPSDGSKAHHVSQQGAKRKHDEVVACSSNKLEVPSNRGVTISRTPGSCTSSSGGRGQGQQARRSPLPTAESSTSPTSKVKQQCWVALNKMVVFDIVDSAMRKSEDEESPSSSSMSSLSSSDKDLVDDNTADNRCDGENRRVDGSSGEILAVPHSKGYRKDDDDRRQLSVDATGGKRVGSPSYMGSSESSNVSGDNNDSNGSQTTSDRVKSDLVSQDNSSCHNDTPTARNNNNNIQYTSKSSFSNNNAGSAAQNMKKRQCEVFSDDRTESQLSKRRRSDTLPVGVAYPGPPSPQKGCVADTHPMVRSPTREATKSNSLEVLLSDSCKDIRPNGTIGRRLSSSCGSESRLAGSCSEAGRLLPLTTSAIRSQPSSEEASSGSGRHLGQSQSSAIDRGSPSEKFTSVNLEHEKAVHVLAPVVIRSPYCMSENNQFAPVDVGLRGGGSKLRLATSRGGESTRGTSTCAQESQMDSHSALRQQGVVTMTSSSSSTRDARSSPRLGWVAVSKIDVHNIVDSVVDSMIAGEIVTSQTLHHDITSAGEAVVSRSSPNVSGTSSSPRPNSSSTSSSPLPSRKVMSPVGSPLPAREAEGCQAATPPQIPSSYGLKSPRTESSSDRGTPSPTPASPCSPASAAEPTDKSFDARMTKAFKWKSSLLMRVEEEKIDVTPDVMTPSEQHSSLSRTSSGKAGKESKTESRNLRSGRRSSRKGASSSVGKLK